MAARQMRHGLQLETKLAWAADSVTLLALISWPRRPMAPAASKKARLSHASRIWVRGLLVRAAGAMASLIALSATVAGVSLRGRSVYGWQTDGVAFDGAAKWLLVAHDYGRNER